MKMGLKLANFRRNVKFGTVTETRLMDRIAPVWGELTGKQLALVARIVEAAYLDGYQAAGGDTSDTISHCGVRGARLAD
jgi:hypothetical protein